MNHQFTRRSKHPDHAWWGRAGVTRAAASPGLDHGAGTATAGTRKPSSLLHWCRRNWWGKNQLNKVVKKAPANKYFGKEGLTYLAVKLSLYICQANAAVYSKQDCHTVLHQEGGWVTEPQRDCVWIHVFGCAFKFSVLATVLLPSGQNLEVNTHTQKKWGSKHTLGRLSALCAIIVLCLPHVFRLFPELERGDSLLMKPEMLWYFLWF